VAFFRFNRDKRGYEYFYLVEPTTNRRGKVKSRVLYWYRTPPGIRVGREPFDESVRRALEAQNPGVNFDWRSIVEAPIPSADADKWRERRRVERAAKHAMASADVDEEVGDERTASEAAETRHDGAEDEGHQSSVVGQPQAPDPANIVGAESTQSTQTLPAAGVDPARKRRRRRRGRRPGAPVPPGGSPGEAPAVDANGAADDTAMSDAGEVEEEDSRVDGNTEPGDD
jgi:hypothetical protein